MEFIYFLSIVGPDLFTQGQYEVSSASSAAVRTRGHTTGGLASQRPTLTSWSQSAITRRQKTLRQTESKEKLWRVLTDALATSTC